MLSSEATPIQDHEVKKNVRREVTLSYGVKGERADFLLQIDCRISGTVAIEMPFVTQVFLDLSAARVWLSSIDNMNAVLKRNLEEMLNEAGAPHISEIK
jgi:hypothetical protein